MALKLGELFVSLLGKDESFSKMLDTAGGKMSAFGDSVSKAGTQMTAKVTAPIAAVGGAALKMSADFEKSGNKLSTIADTSVVSMDDMKKGALGLSSDMGIAATEINEALYQAISATGDTANSLAYVKVASKAAVAGFTDTASSIDGLTTVMNAYGLEGEAALSSVSDQMLMAQNYGKTTFGEMASSIGNVIPIAAAMNVSTEELFASIATLTKNGINTSSAVTGMKAALSNIIKPTAEAAKAAEELGIDFSAARMESIGFSEFIKEVGEATGGSSEKMASLFGSVEALNSMMVLAGTGAEDFDGALLAMSESAGATEEAFVKMKSGTADTFSNLTNEVKNLGIEIGDILVPHLQKVFDLVSVGIEKFKGLDTSTKEQIVSFALIAAAIGPVLIVVGKLISGFGMVMQAGSAIAGLFGSGGALSAALAALTGPVMLIVAAVGILIATFVNLYKNNEEFAAKVNALWDSIKTNFEIIWNSILSIGKSIGEMLSAFWGEWGDEIMVVFEVLWTTIIHIIDVAVNLIAGSLEFISKILQGDFVGAFVAVKEMLARIWEGIGADVLATSEFILGIITDKFNKAWAIVETIFTFIKGKITDDMNAIKGKVNEVVSWITEKIQAAQNAIQGVKDAASKVGSAVSGAISGVAAKVGVSIPKFEEGGIVNKPTLAMIGEGGESEAVIPMSKLNKLMSGAGGKGVDVGSVIVNVSSGDANSIAKNIRQALSFELRKVASI